MTTPTKLDPRVAIEPTLREQVIAVRYHIKIDEDSFRVGGSRSGGEVVFPDRYSERIHECLKAAEKTLMRLRDEQRRARK